MSAIKFAPQPQKYAAWAADYAASIKPSLAKGTTGRAPMSTDVIIGNLEHYVLSTDGGYEAFEKLKPETQQTFHDTFLEQRASDYALVMACAKVAIEHQDNVVRSSNSDPLEVQRKQTLLTAITGAQRCFAKHAWGNQRGPGIH
jgi:hypothetical protein